MPSPFETIMAIPPINPMIRNVRGPSWVAFLIFSLAAFIALAPAAAATWACEDEIKGADSGFDVIVLQKIFVEKNDQAGYNNKHMGSFTMSLERNC
jgi:hypothetical protein